MCCFDGGREQQRVTSLCFIVLCGLSLRVAVYMLSHRLSPKDLPRDNWTIGHHEAIKSEPRSSEGRRSAMRGVNYRDVVRSRGEGTQSGSRPGHTAMAATPRARREREAGAGKRNSPQTF